jgi:hypothetical protein
MHKLIQGSIIFFLAALLLAAPLAAPVMAQAEAESEEATAGSMAYDLFVMRPLGLAATVIGSAVFVLALPFTAITDDVGDSSEKLIADPWDYTIRRPLGTW